MTDLLDLLHGEECPECDEEIDAHGDLRYAGYGWEHKSEEAHPQAGHHSFDVLEALGADEVGINIHGVRRSSPDGGVVELHGTVEIELEDDDAE